ncbi:MAG: 23S rRNA (uracil(1939)-C(5))-methyltransferase RlmD [Spirochaetes bacterium]|nr:23S rRNA (uracil(1939)-C(5))-methyltransferase RlmD [Spirochaetota bacterium]
MGKRKRKNKDFFLATAEEFRGKCTPPCEYFGKCGGCVLQDVEYSDQLEIKKKYLNNLFEGILTVDAVQPGNMYNYRNRMDFVTAFGKSGLRERGNFKNVVDISKCHLMQNRAAEFWVKLKEYLNDIEFYDYLKHEGFLRYCVLRQAAFTEELMCSFVVKKNENLPDKLISFAADNCDTVCTLLSDGLADLSFGPVIETYKGGYITEKFGDIKYQISPNSFFQSNSPVAIQMYEKIRSHVYGRVMDLYSGVGSISLYAASAADTVTGVEIVEDAVKSAKHNAEINNIKNAEFVCADARKFMKENEKKFDTLILDPPRCGIHPKMIASIDFFAPEKIIYMSCNPATFKDDVVNMEKYAIESFEAFDMFPQTPHIETLAVLKRK